MSSILNWASRTPAFFYTIVLKIFEKTQLIFSWKKY